MTGLPRRAGRGTMGVARRAGSRAFCLHPFDNYTIWATARLDGDNPAPCV